MSHEVGSSFLTNISTGIDTPPSLELTALYADCFNCFNCSENSAL